MAYRAAAYPKDGASDNPDTVTSPWRFPHKRIPGDLQEGWNSRFEMMLDDTEGKGVDERKKAGHDFYRNNYVNPQYQLPLFRGKASLYVTKGSYQILSNDKIIGWHPDFKDLLNDDETVE